MHCCPQQNIVPGMCKIVGVNARDDSDFNGCDSFITCAASQPEAMIETPRQPEYVIENNSWVTSVLTVIFVAKDSPSTR